MVVVLFAIPALCGKQNSPWDLKPLEFHSESGEPLFPMPLLYTKMEDSKYEMHSATEK